MKQNTVRQNMVFALFGLLLFSCGEDFLKTSPTGVHSDEIMADENGIDAVLTGAYAALDGVGLQYDGWFATCAWAGSVSNWVWGSVASDDGTKGSDITDSSPIPSIENYSADARNGNVNDKWCANYEGVSRSNDVLRLTKMARNIPETKIA